MLTATPRTAVSSVANWFIDSAAAEGFLLTPLQLQRLSYFAVAYFAALQPKHNCRLVVEVVQAWKHGPVFPVLYRILRPLGGRPVEGQIYEEATRFIVDPPRSGEIVKALHMAWRDYGHATEDELIQASCERGGPWDQVRRTYPNDRTADIPLEAIRLHFMRRWQRSRKP